MKNMKAFPKLLSLLSAGVLVVTLAGCTSTPVDKATPKPTATASATPSADPSLPPAAPIPTLPDSEALKAAQEMFPNAYAVDGYSKEEVQLALSTATTYVQSAYSDSKLLNGKWVAEDDMSYDYLRNKYNLYWTADYDAEVQAMIARVKAAYTDNDQEKFVKESQSLMSVFLYTDIRNLPIVPDDICAEGVATGACLVNSTPVFTKDWQVVNEKNSLRLVTSFDVSVRYVKDGELGQITFHMNDMSFVMERNAAYGDDDEGTPSFVLTGTQATISNDAWTKLEEQ
jgi:hypothetical protein